MWSWGAQDSYGALGLNQSGISKSSPTQIPGTTWKQVTGGMRSGLATKTYGSLWGWGWNYGG